MPIAYDDPAALIHRHPEGVCAFLQTPTHFAGREKTQDPLRLRNMIRSAKRRMQPAGWRAPDIREVICPARRLIRPPDLRRHPKRLLGRSHPLVERAPAASGWAR